MNQPLEDLVEAAKEGDKAALDSLIEAIQDRVYGLAMRMLSNARDAEDATQEILVKVVTHLGSFRGECALTTWVYRIASNHLLSTHKRRAERLEINFDVWERRVETGLEARSTASFAEPEERLLVRETMIGCMQALLLCLNRDLRMTYVLGEVIGIAGPQGAYILGISTAAFRKRLSRARGLVRHFMGKKCGLVNPENACRCEKQVSYAVETGWIKRDRLQFARHSQSDLDLKLIENQVTEIDQVLRIAALFRSHPEYKASTEFIESLKQMMDYDDSGVTNNSCGTEEFSILDHRGQGFN